MYGDKHFYLFKQVSSSKLEHGPEFDNLNQNLMSDVAQTVVAILSEPTRESQLISIKRFFLPDKPRPQVTVTLLGCTPAEDQLKFSNVDEQGQKFSKYLQFFFIIINTIN